MKGLDAALGKYPWMDGSRVAALGASYGGFMINWINGHTDRFKALVCHSGNLDERMAYYDTEELWFPEWERGGTPWTAPESYSHHNPIDHVEKWATPTLVIHGANDFRVVDTQGMSTYTALQRPLCVLPRREPLDPQAQQLAAVVSRGQELAGSFRSGALAQG